MKLNIIKGFDSHLFDKKTNSSFNFNNGHNLDTAKYNRNMSRQFDRSKIKTQQRSYR